MFDRLLGIPPVDRHGCFAAVGSGGDIQYAATVTDLVKRLYIDHDFDMTYTSYAITDAVPLMRLQALRSNSSNNLLGYESSEMDALLDKTQQATDDADEKAGFAQIADLINKDAPFLTWSAGANFVPWAKNVHGALPSNDGIMLLGKAWLS